MIGISSVPDLDCPVCIVGRIDDLHGHLREGANLLGAYVPDLPGVITVGDSRDEVERFIQEAIEFHLEGMREEGQTIPVPSSFAGVVEVDPVG